MKLFKFLCRDPSPLLPATMLCSSRADTGSCDASRVVHMDVDGAKAASAVTARLQITVQLESW